MKKSLLMSALLLSAATLAGSALSAPVTTAVTADLGTTLSPDAKSASGAVQGAATVTPDAKSTSGPASAGTSAATSGTTPTPTTDRWANR